MLDDRSARAEVDPSRYLFEDEDEIVWKDAPKPKPKFDCVSILSKCIIIDIKSSENSNL